MNNFLKKSGKVILFILCLVIFSVIVYLLMNDYVETFDSTVYSFISKLKCEPITYFFKVISFLCSSWFLTLATLFIILFVKDKKVGFYVMLNVILCVVLNQSLKFLFARSRPIDINLIIEHGYSFPSGHSMVSLAFYGFFIYLIALKNIRVSKKILYCFLLAFLILLIGISRIYLGVHFASDVLAGFSLSMSYLICYIALYNKMNMQKMKKRYTSR